MGLSLPKPVGHLLDANTLALWRLDEVSAGQANDETGTYPLITLSGTPAVVLGEIGNARAIAANQAISRGGIVPGDPFIAALRSSIYTAEAWFWIDPIIVWPTWLGTGNNHGALFSVNGAGNGSAFIFGLDSGFFIYNVSNGFSSIGSWASLSKGAWHHLAVRATPADATHTLAEFFLDGLKVGSVTILTYALTPSTNSSLTIGGEGGTFNNFTGRIDDVRISKVARSDAEIFDSYRRGALGLGPDVVSTVAARALPTFSGHKLDANTLALWRLDEVSGSASAADATGKYAAPAVNNGGFPSSVTGIIADGGNAKRFNGGFYNIASLADAAMGTALLGEWTIESWFNLDSMPGGIDARIVDISDGTKRYVWLSVNTAGRLQIFWQAGTNQSYDDTTTLFAAGIRYHAAARKVSLGGGNYRVDFFVNGLKISSSGSLLNSTASGAPTAGNIGSGLGGAPFTGVIDDVRISKVARTDDEILDSYRRGVVGTAADPVAPMARVTDHVARALAALIEQYKNKPKMVGLLTAFIGQVQDGEDGLWPAASEMNIQCASGAELDLLGRIVGETRSGRADLSYRTAIQARILLNLSSGTIEEIYSLFLLILSVNGLSPAMQLVEMFPKSFILRLQTAAVPDAVAADLGEILQKVKDAGARATLDYGNTTPFFGFDGSTGFGFDTGYLGGTA
jgi:hypothetical protein